MANRNALSYPHTGRRLLPEIANDVRGGKVITVEFLVVTRAFEAIVPALRFHQAQRRLETIAYTFTKNDVLA